MTDEKLVCPYCGGDRFIMETTDVVEIIQTEGDGSKDEVVGDNLPSLIDAEYDYKCEHCKMGLNDDDFISKNEAEFALLVTIDRDDRPNAEILYSADTVEKVEEVMNLLAIIEYGSKEKMDEPTTTEKIIDKLGNEYGVAWFDQLSNYCEYIPEIRISRIVKLDTIKQF